MIAIDLEDPLLRQDSLELPRPEHLFDLEADPKEMNNVYADPDYAEVVVEMTAELDRLQVSVGDVGLH